MKRINWGSWNKKLYNLQLSNQKYPVDKVKSLPKTAKYRNRSLIRNEETKYFVRSIAIIIYLFHLKKYSYVK